MAMLGRQPTRRGARLVLAPTGVDASQRALFDRHKSAIIYLKNE